MFRQWGLDTLPLEQSGMQGLYVVDSGKVVYQKTGAGPLEYTLSWGGHDVTLRSAVDNSSIAVDGEEQSRNRPGVNVLVYDKGAGPRHPVHQFLHAPRIQRIYGMMQRRPDVHCARPAALLCYGGTPAYGARGCFAR